MNNFYTNTTLAAQELKDSFKCLAWQVNNKNNLSVIKRQIQITIILFFKVKRFH